MLCNVVHAFMVWQWIMQWQWWGWGGAHARGKVEEADGKLIAAEEVAEGHISRKARELSNYWNVAAVVLNMD